MDVTAVLAAVNGDDCDEEVVRLACDLLNSQHDKLYILYVIELERALPVDAEIASATAQGEKVLKRIEAVAKSYKRKPAAALVQARDAGSAVVREAVDKNVGTIVLGAPYRKLFGSFSLGEMACYVLKNAPCRVIVWRDSMSRAYSNSYQV